MSAPEPLLTLEEVSVSFPEAWGLGRVVDRVSFDLAPGEILALVGESGSGKTLAARSIMGLLPPAAEVVAGSIRFKGQELSGRDPRALRRLRGAEIGMIFQEPMVSLNPSLSVGRQMAEAMELHSELSRAQIRQASIDMLAKVGLPEPARCLERFPHEFSGGMRQRIMLASVMLPRPALLLADEPTTALDVIIQKQVLDILVSLTRELGTAVLLITHDLGVVASYAQRVAVMRKGAIVEGGRTEELLRRPRHPYTQALLAALPGMAARPAVGRSEAAPLLSVRDLVVSYRERKTWPWSPPRLARAVSDVSLEIAPGETLAVVGESGSGKTTIGRSLMGLVTAESGRLRIGDRDLNLAGQAAKSLRQDLQIVFQDPFSSLDPRMRLGDIVGEGLRHRADLTRQQRRARALQGLAEVGLSEDFVLRYPHELSGGQRQRVAIARAIAMRPKLIVADEPVSALDMTIQAQILELLKRLQSEHGFSYLFISHDLGVVKEIADRILVLYRGRVVEEGPAAALLETPRHPYTAALLDAVPQLVREGEGYRLAKHKPRSAAPPAGYRFAAGGDEAEVPLLLEAVPGHRVACLKA
ncbi:MAG: ABC transporter ATP-binding protein [Rhodospirillales bacterium]